MEMKKRLLVIDNPINVFQREVDELGVFCAGPWAMSIKNDPPSSELAWLWRELDNSFTMSADFNQDSF